ncbi:PilZ domain-containing protein [Pelagibius sp. Alg239-R121]|uniref:PilZ domain-containing protein n=1 Tax=Pelagibius sp. Alg239-R121 TaxID=2993448 RepID=UPI0024A657C8|nr:PilZ domain-containing protein [Pelagibius sp. Alg239-R121]
MTENVTEEAALPGEIDAAESEDVQGAEISPAPESSSEEPQSEAAENGEPPQRRRELRELEVTGTVVIQGDSFPLKDWSSSGFGVTGCKIEFEENARIDIDFSITLSSGPLAFSCKAIIVRADAESGDVAGAFVEMRREDRVTVARYFDSMEAGESA